MRITGIVRKIDELGRIVLPKEIRTFLNINAGDDFQILLEGNNIVLEKYSRLISSKDKIIEILDCFSQTYKIKTYLIIDDVIVNYNEKVFPALSSLIKERKNYASSIVADNKISSSIAERGRLLLSPIVVNSDLLGSIVIIGSEPVEELNNILKIIILLIKNFYKSV